MTQFERIAAGSAEALFELRNHIWRQGVVTEETIAAIPFLWETLEGPDRGIHDAIAGLLSLVAQGDSSDPVTAQRVRDQVWKGASIAEWLLLSHNEAVRRSAAAVLACFPESRDQTIPLLRQALSFEGASAEYRAALGLGLAALGQFEKAAFQGSKSEFVQEAKALAQEAAAGDPDAIATALDVLCDAAPDDDPTDWI